MTDAARSADPKGQPYPAASGLLLVTVLGMAVRALAIPGATQNNMDADAAHFLNIARCFARGQGFSNPASWPAWMRPEHLPMPETFKEPGYPWLISHLAPLIHDPFRAGQAISLVAGLLLPLALYALARNLNLSRGTALLAAALVAINPLLAGFSVTVMVESIFAATMTLAFALATARRDDPGRPRPWILDVATGVALGVAFMLRAQTLVSLPAFAVAFMLVRQPVIGARRFTVALAAAVLTASPFILRNLRLFGTPLHSDISAFGIWAYVDRVAFSHGLDHPQAPLAFAITHVPEILRHVAQGVARFAWHSLPTLLLGNPVWVPAFAVGALLAIADWRRWLFAFLYVGCTFVLVFTVSWDERYFSSSTPLFLMLAAWGATWIAGRIGSVRLLGPITSRAVLIATLVALAALQAMWTRRMVAVPTPSELGAARAEAAWLSARLRPEEAVMAVTTSYFAWFTDRPTVHLVIADRERFLGEIRRLKVRYAAFPTSRLAEFAARYPGGRLPDVLVLDHEDPAHDISVFSVRPEPATR